MNKFLMFLLFGAYCLLSACGESRTEALEKIKDIEKKLLDARGKPKDDQSAYNLQVLYDDFAVRFPDDSLAPEYLFKTAEIGLTIKGGGESNVKVLEKFLTMFPNDKRVPDALFLLGYVHDHQLNNYTKAKEFYTSFLNKYPKHLYYKDALFRSVEIGLSNNGSGISNVKALENFLTMFPNDKRAPEALFLLGYVYDNQLNNDDKAKEYYSSFLKKYPEHPYCKDAEMSMKNLGKSDEEIIREFEKMNADSAQKKSFKTNP